MLVNGTRRYLTMVIIQVQNRDVLCEVQAIERRRKSFFMDPHYDVETAYAIRRYNGCSTDTSKCILFCTSHCFILRFRENQFLRALSSKHRSYRKERNKSNNSVFYLNCTGNNTKFPINPNTRISILMDKRYLTLILILCCAFGSQAQSLKDLLDKGDRLYARKDFADALQTFITGSNHESRRPRCKFQAGNDVPLH